MAPSMDDLKRLLRQKAKEIFASDERDALTVRLVRDRVAEETNLNNDFTTGAEWKAMSKRVIQQAVQKLLEDEEERDKESSEDDTELTPKKKGLKRHSPDDHQDHSLKPPKAKKAKKDAIEKPAKKRRATKKGVLLDDEVNEPEQKKTEASGRPRKKAVSGNEEDNDLSGQPRDTEEEHEEPPAKARNGSKKPTSDTDDLSDPPSDDNEEAAKGRGRAAQEGPNPKKSVVGAKHEDDPSDRPAEEPDPTKARDEDVEMRDVSPGVNGPKSGGDVPPENENDYSDVIDEAPKPKRKSRGPREAKEPKEKGKRGRRAAAPKATLDLGPDDQEIKKLQGQLVKCGVRKIWAFELKKYGDDSRGKIRHLRDMLKDVGMEGRFSEAKAAAIKEQRELLADLEAVTEGERHWGVSGRASRGRGNKSYRVSPDSEDDAASNGGNDDDDDGNGASSNDRGAKPKSNRWRDQQAALAALLSGSESD